MSAKDNLGPEFDLLAESSHNEANIIKFFGVAFGNSLNTHEISSKNAFSNVQPVETEWYGQKLGRQIETDLFPVKARTLLLSIFYLTTATPKAGHLQC
tara:strand:+ start:1609 stop:1902 length:294 start_codon:yes stop_codon:yes gene_type:complete